MKHIRHFENFTNSFGGESDPTTTDGAAFKLRSLIKDLDIDYSLGEIKSMLQNGEFKSAIESYDINMVFATAIEKDRLDIADVVRNAGYKITNVKKVNDWLENSKYKSDDKLYSIRRYT